MNVELGLLYKSPKSEFKNDGAFPLVESTIDYISWAHYKKNAQKKQSLFTRLRKLICRKSPHSAQLDNHSLPVDQSASSTIHKEDFPKEPSPFSRLQKLTRGENSRSPQPNKQRSGEKGERC